MNMLTKRHLPKMPGKESDGEKPDRILLLGAQQRQGMCQEGVAESLECCREAEVRENPSHPWNLVIRRLTVWRKPCGSKLRHLKRL